VSKHSGRKVEVDIGEGGHKRMEVGYWKAAGDAEALRQKAIKVSAKDPSGEPLAGSLIAEIDT
jgi:hypothetical protein